MTNLRDPEGAADVFYFYSDQFRSLHDAGALQQIDIFDSIYEMYANRKVKDIKNETLSSAIASVSYDGKLYAIPASVCNGYFLYYDSSVLSANDVKSWDSLLAAADRAGKKVGMTMDSGWYTSSFFYGAGFDTGLNADGSTFINWNETADYSGAMVAQAMLGIINHNAFLNIQDGYSSSAFLTGEYCAIVSGTWDQNNAQDAFGSGYAATKLPTYTISGEQVQQVAVIGYECVGVNPYSMNVGWAGLLAEWITNEENQSIRYESRTMAPANVNAVSSSSIKENVAIYALMQQGEYGYNMVVGSGFWTATQEFGIKLLDGSVKDISSIQNALDEMISDVKENEY